MIDAKTYQALADVLLVDYLEELGDNNTFAERIEAFIETIPDMVYGIYSGAKLDWEEEQDALETLTAMRRDRDEADDDWERGSQRESTSDTGPFHWPPPMADERNGTAEAAMPVADLWNWDEDTGTWQLPAAYLAHGPVLDGDPVVCGTVLGGHRPDSEGGNGKRVLELVKALGVEPIIDADALCIEMEQHLFLGPGTFCAGCGRVSKVHPTRIQVAQ